MRPDCIIELSELRACECVGGDGWADKLFLRNEPLKHTI